MNVMICVSKANNNKGLNNSVTVIGPNPIAQFAKF